MKSLEVSIRCIVDKFFVACGAPVVENHGHLPLKLTVDMNHNKWMIGH